MIGKLKIEFKGFNIEKLRKAIGNISLKIWLHTFISLVVVRFHIATLVMQKCVTNN
jgi:hypothetical protein